MKLHIPQIQKQNILSYLVLIPYLVLGIAYGQNTSIHKNTTQVFKPSSIPLLRTQEAKPNIQFVTNDSGIMLANAPNSGSFNGIMVPEHALKFGDPFCSFKAEQHPWRQERKAKGEYDPFATGRYVPWDDKKAVNGLIGEKKKPPLIMQCKAIVAGSAIEYITKDLIRKYRDKSYLGISTFSKRPYRIGVQDGLGTGFLLTEINDISKLSPQAFEQTIIKPLGDLFARTNSFGNPPYLSVIYETIKMYRSHPVNPAGELSSAYNSYGGPPLKYTNMATPLKYRCQQNHVVAIITDNNNSNKIWGVSAKDIDILKAQRDPTLGSSPIIDGVSLGFTANLMNQVKNIGKSAAIEDLRQSQKLIHKDGQWIEKKLDDAGREWSDHRSIPMSIIINTVELKAQNSINSGASSLAKLTGGQALTYSDGDTDNLFVQLDQIFSNIVRHLSSMGAVNDRVFGQINIGKPSIINGTVDTENIGVIRYSTLYKFSIRSGSLKASVPYVSQINNAKNEIELFNLWNTDETIKANQGRYVTFLPDVAKNNKLAELDTDDVKKEFSAIYQAKTGIDNAFTDGNYINWMTNFEQIRFSNNLRTRITPLGSITSSDIKIVNKDILNINIEPKRMSKILSKEMTNFLLFKAKYQPTNLLIVEDNDGFISFINAQRGITDNHKAGERNTTYFPRMLVPRIDEIAKTDSQPTLIMDGKTNVVDAKVYQEDVGDIYATIGLTTLGGGGKGLVGYRIYAASKQNVDDWSNHKIMPPQPTHSNTIDKVMPLFEISNEGPDSYKTKGFENLGYTYSGIQFFNRTNANDEGQAVAVFGNGFGVDKSTLYFIDAYTGEKLSEIILNPNGGGASTPSMIVSHDSNGQKIDRIYVGDYSGALYRITFNSKDIQDMRNIEVTMLFKAPNNIGHYGQSAISVKPLVIQQKNSNQYKIFLGTGLLASAELDVGDNSLVTHNIYGISDLNRTANHSSTTAYDMNILGSTLSPLLSISDLGQGSVYYQNETDVDYGAEKQYRMGIKTPSQNINGWYIPLTADSASHKGERLTLNPKYDEINDAIIFSTFGLIEDSANYSNNGLYDPCLRDTPFGKVLSLDSKTGSGTNNGKLTNIGITDNVIGGIIGTGIQDAPEGNETTDISELDDAIIQELILSTGKANSSISSEDDSKNIIGSICGTMMMGDKGICDDVILSPKEPLSPRRISLWTIF